MAASHWACCGVRRLEGCAAPVPGAGADSWCGSCFPDIFIREAEGSRLSLSSREIAAAFDGALALVFDGVDNEYVGVRLKG